MYLHGKDDDWSIGYSSFDINSFMWIITPVEDEKEKIIEAKMSNEKHNLLIIKNTHVSVKVTVPVASEVKRTVANKRFNGCHCILFPDVKWNLMMRNSNLEGLAKSQEVFFSWNVIKLNLSVYSF